MTTMLKPWQRLTVTCQRCDRTATHRVVANAEPQTETAPDGTVNMYIGGAGRPDLHAELACDYHVHDALTDASRAGGHGAWAPFLRERWWAWITRVIRPIGRLDHAIYEWRWERGVEGKRFGLKLRSVYLGEADDTPDQPE